MATNCGITPAQSNRVQVTYTKEDPACFGKLPSSGVVTRKFRPTDFNPVIQKDTQISNEIRADRMTSGEFSTSRATETEAPAEFSAGNIDLFFEGLFSTTWSRELDFHKVQGTSVSITANNTIEIASTTDFSVYFPVLRTVKTEGWLNPENNTYATIATSAFAANVTTLTVTGTPFVIESSSQSTSILDANDVLVTGTTLQTDATGIHAGGASVFTSGVAAGYYKTGRYIYLQGLGYQKGSLQFTGQPTAGETVTLNIIESVDGNTTTVPKTYEFVASVGDSTTVGNVEVVIGATANDTAAAMSAAVMSVFAGQESTISSSVATDTVSLRQVSNDMGASITGTPTNVTITAFTAGDASAQGLFKIVNATDTLLTVSPTPGTDANASGDTVVLKGSHIAPPDVLTDIVPTSFQTERHYSDLGLYELYTGNRVESITLEMGSGDLVASNVNFMGTTALTSSTATISDSGTYEQRDILTTPVLNATSNMESIDIDGTQFPTIVTSMNLEIGTSLRKQNVLTRSFPAGVGEGRINVSMSLEAYFLNHDQYNDFINDEYRSYDFFMTDLDSNRYVFSIPRAFTSGDNISSGGIDNDVTQELDLTGHFDDNTKTSIIISKFSSTIPFSA